MNDGEKWLAPASLDIRVEIDIEQQRLLFYGGEGKRQYRVSTSSHGAGELIDSNCTPRGLMKVKVKIGANEHTKAVFVGRRPSGEICDRQTYERVMQGDSRRDWILGRIIWLGGMEPHFNRFGQVDTLRRYIYIHGTPDEVDINHPGSIGCIRMRCPDVLSLFTDLESGDKVLIRESMNQPVVVVDYWDDALMAALLHDMAAGDDETNAMAWQSGDGTLSHKADLAFTGYDQAGKLAAIARLMAGEADCTLRLYVSRNNRRMGLGTAIMKKALQVAKNLTLPRIKMDCAHGAKEFFSSWQHQELDENHLGNDSKAKKIH